ncbi:unnamed protein product, partial [marine sediment metagenome]
LNEAIGHMENEIGSLEDCLSKDEDTFENIEETT